MIRCSNSLIGILNFCTLIISLPLVFSGKWLSNQAGNDCEKWVEQPIFIFGVFLLVVSLFGLIGSCCRVTWLLWMYLFVLFLLIVAVFAVTIFAFVVTNRGRGEALWHKGYIEYKVEDYSKWLQNRVNSTETWNKIKTCMQSGKICSVQKDTFLTELSEKFNYKKLLADQSGCCKPSNDCNFIYQSSTIWNKPTNATYTNPDCDAWSNDPTIMCFNCQSCKADFLQRLKSDLTLLGVVNSILLFFLTTVFSIGCCAFRNNQVDDWRRYYSRY